MDRTDGLLRQALQALEYHRDQTRPIHQTDVVITALRERLGSDAAVKLTLLEQSVLDALSTIGADTVAALRGRTGFSHFDPRSQATVHTAILKKLEARGLVRRLDDQRPIAWLRA